MKRKKVLLYTLWTVSLVICLFLALLISTAQASDWEGVWYNGYGNLILNDSKAVFLYVHDGTGDYVERDFYQVRCLKDEALEFRSEKETFLAKFELTEGILRLSPTSSKPGVIPRIPHVFTSEFWSREKLLKSLTNWEWAPLNKWGYPSTFRVHFYSTIAKKDETIFRPWGPYDPFPEEFKALEEIFKSTRWPMKTVSKNISTELKPSQRIPIEGMWVIYSRENMALTTAMGLMFLHMQMMFPSRAFDENEKFNGAIEFMNLPRRDCHFKYVVCSPREQKVFERDRLLFSELNLDLPDHVVLAFIMECQQGGIIRAAQKYATEDLAKEIESYVYKDESPWLKLILTYRSFEWMDGKTKSVDITGGEAFVVTEITFAKPLNVYERMKEKCPFSKEPVYYRRETPGAVAYNKFLDCARKVYTSGVCNETGKVEFRLRYDSGKWTIVNIPIEW